MTEERIGNCSVCGRSAAVNTPHIDKIGKLYCYICARNSEAMLQGMEQYKNEDGTYKLSHTFTKSHCIVHSGFDVCAYSDDGHKYYKLTDEERAILISDPERILDKIIDMRMANRYRCSECGVEMNEAEVGAFPLFAGVICKKCSVGYFETIENQKKNGQVCRMCHQPWALCCC